MPFVYLGNEVRDSAFKERSRECKERRGPVESDHNFAALAGTLSVDETHVPTDVLGSAARVAYEDEVYLVTALVPSDTACLASSPGRARRTAVWISREVRVPFLL